MTPFENKIIDEAISFAKSKMQNIHSSHGWDHVLRVVNIAEKITSSEKNADLFIVKTAAILHDIARKYEDSDNGKTCHAKKGGEIAYNFLLDCGLDEKKSSHIKSCISTHRYRSNEIPSTIEAKILYDADKLDSIGAVGIGRAFLFSGELGAKLHNSNIDLNATEAYSNEDTAYREYMVKLRFVKEKMLTLEGKRLSEERHVFMEEFFKRLQHEIDGVL